MPPDPRGEVEAFARWLAMSPHKLEEFAADPDGFLDGANCGEQARLIIKGYGVDGIRTLVRETAQQTYSDPEAGVIHRDTTVRGFGARPADPE